MRIIPNNNEVTFDEKTLLVTKTDTKGIITYANRAFMQTVKMSERELIGKPHNLIRHPDMPRIIFKFLWQYLKSKKEINAYVKNLCSDGSYYWVFANVTPSYIDGKITGYHSARKKPKAEAIEIVIPLYKKLLEAEKRGGIKESEKILTSILNDKGVEYEKFILSI